MSDKKYTDEQWLFIKHFEEADPVFSEYLARQRAHDRKYFLDDYGMTAEDMPPLRGVLYSWWLCQ